MNMQNMSVTEAWQQFKEQKGDNAILELFLFLSKREEEERAELSPLERLPVALGLLHLAYQYTQMQADIYRAKTDEKRASIRKAHFREIEQLLNRQFDIGELTSGYRKTNRDK